MSSKVNKILRQFLTFNILVLKISLAVGDCTFEVDSDKSLRPNIFINFGTNKIPFIISETSRYGSVFAKQEIEAHCKTKFTSPTHASGINQLSLKCENDYWHLYKGQEYIGNYFERLLQCSTENWNLYEVIRNFTWCPYNTTAYLLARPMGPQTKKYLYLAGICYDVLNVSFKSLYYTIAPSQLEYKYPIIFKDLHELGLEIKYLKETFGPRRISEYDYDNQVERDWIKFSHYNYSSVIQNSLLVNQFNYELGSLLDFAWWPNLRLGNWKAYESALTRHVESQQQSYNILAGVSDTAKVPIIESCQSNYTLRELFDSRQYNKIPLYVWNYLSSTTNSSDAIVVIGLNSPFFEFHMENDVVFCPDRCHEIPWLAKVSTTFRFSAMGIVFCCNPEDVITSKRLDGFPEIDNLRHFNP